MSMRVVLCVPLVAAGIIGAALMAGGTAAAADCITEPNRDAPAGSHWYYRLDHANNRKCWYLQALPAGAAEAPAPAAAELQSVHPPRRPAAPRRTPASDADAATPQRRAPVAEAAALQRRAPVTEAVAPQRRAPMSESEEAALYLEYLRWREQHRSTP